MTAQKHLAARYGVGSEEDVVLLVFDSIQCLFIVNGTEIGRAYILLTCYASLNYCSETVNTFHGGFSCHKAIQPFWVSLIKDSICLFRSRITFSSIFSTWICVQ